MLVGACGMIWMCTMGSRYVNYALGPAEHPSGPLLDSPAASGLPAWLPPGGWPAPAVWPPGGGASVRLGAHSRIGVHEHVLVHDEWVMGQTGVGECVDSC